jgi:glycosyltransferase involved in cell wall biosynthesis
LKYIFFTKYTRAGASSRYRSFQYLPALEAAGLNFTVSSLLSDDYLKNKYIYGRTRFGDILRAFVRRIWAVLTVPRDAVVVIQHELLPWCPALLERLLGWRGCRMVVDYDDAIFHQYDRHCNPWIRCLLGKKIVTVMQLAHTVTVGNNYLAEFARTVGASRVQVIPTVVALDRYLIKDPTLEPEVFTIGWIGSPSTARYLREIAPALEQVCRSGRSRVRLIGSGQVELKGVPLELFAWSEETEVAAICDFDVGIMPLPDEPWARGKCGLKLIQYMACGIPVVASPVGVNVELVKPGFNGFLARSTVDWVDSLETLKFDQELRRAMGVNGRARVKEKYCLNITAPVFVDILQRVVQEN